MSSLLSPGTSALIAAEGIYDAAAAQRSLVRFSRSTGDKSTLCVFDCAKQETYKYTSKATRLPVEDGPDISDNIVHDPVGLDFELMIVDSPLRDTSDTKAQYNDPSTYDRQLVTEAGLTTISAAAGPLGIAAAATGYSLYNASPTAPGGAFSAQDGPPSRSITAYGVLRDCRNAGELLTVKTKLGTFSNMVIESLSIPRDSKTGDALSFSISLTQLNIVASQSISANDVRDGRRAVAKRKMGEQQVETQDLFSKGRAAGNEVIKSNNLTDAMSAFQKAGLH